MRLHTAMLKCSTIFQFRQWTEEDGNEIQRYRFTRIKGKGYLAHEDSEGKYIIVDEHLKNPKFDFRHLKKDPNFKSLF